MKRHCSVNSTSSNTNTNTIKRQKSSINNSNTDIDNNNNQFNPYKQSNAAAASTAAAPAPAVPIRIINRGHRNRNNNNNNNNNSKPAVISTVVNNSYSLSSVLPINHLQPHLLTFQSVQNSDTNRLIQSMNNPKLTAATSIGSISTAPSIVPYKLPASIEAKLAATATTVNNNNNPTISATAAATAPITIESTGSAESAGSLGTIDSTLTLDDLHSDSLDIEYAVNEADYHTAIAKSTAAATATAAAIIPTTTGKSNNRFNRFIQNPNNLSPIRFNNSKQSIATSSTVINRSELQEIRSKLRFRG